jgi:hypothetical protein
MAREICATVPQFIHSIALASKLLTSAVDVLNLDENEKPKVEPNIAQQLACYRLLHPLCVAARTLLVSQDIRNWTI